MYKSDFELGNFSKTLSVNWSLFKTDYYSYKVVSNQLEGEIQSSILN